MENSRGLPLLDVILCIECRCKCWMLKSLRVSQLRAFYSSFWTSSLSLLFRVHCGYTVYIIYIIYYIVWSSTVLVYIVSFYYYIYTGILGRIGIASSISPGHAFPISFLLLPRKLVSQFRDGFKYLLRSKSRLVFWDYFTRWLLLRWW